MVAEHAQPRLGAQLDVDALGLGGDPDPVERLVEHLVDAHEVRLVEGVGDLQAGEVDDLLDQPGEPHRLDPHPAREAGDRLRVVAGRR